MKKTGKAISLVAYVMSATAFIAAGQTNSISSIPRSLGQFESILAQYQRCELPQAFLAKRDRDGAEAWQIPPGIVVLEYTPGALVVLRGTLFVSVEDGVMEFAIASIEPTKGEMVIQLPGERERRAKGKPWLMYENPMLISTERQESENQSKAMPLRSEFEQRRGEAVSLLTERYGRPRASGELGATNALTGTETIQWKVGDGHLQVEVSVGAGIVDEITYVIGIESEEKSTRIKVKDVDLTKGEMTLVIPGRGKGH